MTPAPIRANVLPVPTLVRATLRPLLLASLLLGAVPARADGPDESPPDVEALIRDGRFDEALAELLPAYASNPSAPMAHAVARCYDGQGDVPNAIRFYTSAVELGLDKKLVGYTKRRLDSLKKRLKTLPKKVTLSVSCNADGALVRLDGQVIGKTPLSGVLVAPGRHALTVESPGYDSWSKEFSGEVYQTVVLKALLLDQPTGVLVTTSPPGVTATIEGRSCVTPCLVSLRAGSYTVSLKRGDRPVVTRTFDKPAGKMAEVAFELEGVAAVEEGRLELRGAPDGARVSIDDTEIGTAPITTPILLAAGRHRVRVDAAGRPPHETQLEVKPGALVVVTVAWPDRVPKTIQPEPKAVEPPGTSRDAARRRFRIAGWTCIGVGTASIGGGVGLTVAAVLGKRKIDLAKRALIVDEDAAAGEPAEREYVFGVTRADAVDLESRARKFVIAAGVLYGVGLASLIAGIVLVVIEPPAPTPATGVDRPKLGHLGPWLAPGLAGATATVTF